MSGITHLVNALLRAQHIYVNGEGKEYFRQRGVNLRPFGVTRRAIIKTFNALRRDEEMETTVSDRVWGISILSRIVRRRARDWRRGGERHRGYIVRGGGGVSDRGHVRCDGGETAGWVPRVGD